MFNRKGEVLLARISRHVAIPKELWGKWDFPGGGLNFDESLEQGLWRELEEEIGQVKVEMGEPIVVRDWIQPNDSTMRTVCITYKGKFLGGKIKLNEEHDQWVWVKRENLDQYKLAGGEAVREQLKKIMGEGSAGEWLKYPTGKIGKGTICPRCARYNARDLVCHAVAVRKDGKILLIKRDIEPMKGDWALPGGYLGWDETTAECALRELKEETGLTGKNPQLLGIYDDLVRDVDGRQNVGLAHVVEAEGDVGELDEVSEVAWFAPENVPKELAFDHKKMIEDYIGRINTNPAVGGPINTNKPICNESSY